MAQIGPGFALDGGDKDKTLQEEYQGVMRGLRGIARIMSSGFVKASLAVQSVVNRSLSGVIRRDLCFIEGVSSTLMRWIRAFQPAIDSLDRPAATQIRLRSDARRDGMIVAQEILDPSGVGGVDDPSLDPLHEIIVRAFAAARTPTERAIIEVHEQLAPLTEQYVPPGQERVFLSRAFNVICAYIQEVRSMVLGQAVLPTQIVPGVWGARWGILAEAPLLAPQIGPVPTPAPAQETESTEPPEKVEAGIQSDPTPPAAATKPLATEVPSQQVQPKLLVAPLSTRSPAKSSKSKGTPGSSSKQLFAQQSVRTLWNDPERAREDEAFERSQAQDRPGEIPVVLMDDENVDRILAGQRPTQLSSSSHPTATAARPKMTPSSTRTTSSAAVRSGSPVPQDRSGRASPTQPRPSDLTVPMPAPVQMPAHWKRESTAPAGSDDVIVVKDDDEPLASSSSKSKGSAKKTRNYTPEEEAARQELRNQLHSTCRQIRYSLEFDEFKKYRRTIPNLRTSVNTDDHTEYLREYVLKDQPQSYSCVGNLLTVKAFQKRLRAECKDPAKVEKAEKALWDKALPGVPDESKEDSQWERLTARYVMQVLQNRKGTIIDSHHADWGRDNNIRLYDINSPLSMAKVEKSGTTRFQGQSLPAKVAHGYCPMCLYASENHRTLNNHVRLHYRMTMVCGYPGCWEVLHNASTMWAHAHTHGFSVAEPCAPRQSSKKK